MTTVKMKIELHMSQKPEQATASTVTAKKISSRAGPGHYFQARSATIVSLDVEYVLSSY